jgi:Fe-S-cluster-containing hydrogenase component 2
LIVDPIPTIDFEKCLPEKCEHGICKAIGACSHKAFIQEEPYEFPMHIASSCTGCRACEAACPLKAIRTV